MIPAQAVEAAAKHFYEDATGLTSWDRLCSASPDIAERYRLSMTRAIEAAAPIIRREAEEKTARAIESEVRAWEIIARLYDITPSGYKLGDHMESAVARALAHLGELRAAAEGDKG